MNTPPDLIIAQVSLSTGVGVTDMISPRRNAESVRARHIAIHLIRRMTDLSFPKIGLVMGDRDHTTIMHALEAIQAQIAADPRLADFVREIETTIRWREAFAEAATIDVLSLARRIAAKPRFEGMRTNVVEVDALARGMLDTWELVQAYRELTNELTAGMPLEDDFERSAVIADLTHNITTMERHLTGADGD